MQDKYLIIYQNSACLFRREIVSVEDLSYWVDKIVNDYKGEIFTISKCLVSA
jgi:hypothetical protein